MFKKTLITFLLLIMPFSASAYSDRIIASGETVGITLNTDGVLVVGTYNIKNTSPAKSSGLKAGDLILKINNTRVYSTMKLAEIIDGKDKIEIEYKREGSVYSTTLQLVKEDDVLKTGLYVKDSVTGIGTVTFIDPETKIFGALGHEITNQANGDILEIKDGKIVKSEVTGIVPSTKGKAGEKNAKYDTKIEKGDVLENTNKGIFGNYTYNVDNSETYKVAKTNEIKEGKAYIKTVLEGKSIKKYEINITDIKNDKTDTKNFVFEITDEELINKTGGIVQGMSGSPIIQGDYIVGAVTHVIVDNPIKGYGIFITNMLKEAEN